MSSESWGARCKKIRAELLWDKWGGGGCKVLGTDRAAEGLETIEMESLQRKFVVYYLYDRNKHLEKEIPAGKRWRHPKFSNRIRRWREKQHCSIRIAKYWKHLALKRGVGLSPAQMNHHRHQPERLKPGSFCLFVDFLWAFLQCDICGAPEHQMSHLNSCWAARVEKQKKTGSRLASRHHNEYPDMDMWKLFNPIFHPLFSPSFLHYYVFL